MTRRRGGVNEMPQRSVKRGARGKERLCERGRARAGAGKQGADAPAASVGAQRKSGAEAPPFQSLAVFFAVVFFAAVFFAGVFFRPPFLADFSAISATACSIVTLAGSVSLGRVALTLPHFT